ncbi:MAG: RNA methyltransferase [Gammaproteobacteria bacterium]|nr:RNA methyltransferase [Gammaproteobacteria bacterium]MDP2139369.1 RNA methyltransferase [Gammaproteobacteria bacterium]MDP2346205.1 RNA methyltransferase [Gammaproteobacteria bacterium]
MSDKLVIANNFNNIRIILVNTSHPGNIGATARAMKNMGLTQLTLVDPEDFPSSVATGRAVAAVDILESAVVTSTLEEAIVDCGLVIGASARSRRLPWPLLSPPQCAVKVADESRNNVVALVFGREDSGLTNEELQLCHFHVHIPADEQYSSLNLAAAVMVVSYEVRMELLRREQRVAEGDHDVASAQGAADDVVVTGLDWDVPRATGQQMESFYSHLEQAMIDLNFHDPENPRLLMMRMRRLFGRIRPDQMEISILRGLLSHIDMLNERATRGISVEQQRKERKSESLKKSTGAGVSDSNYTGDYSGD